MKYLISVSVVCLLFLSFNSFSFGYERNIECGSLFYAKAEVNLSTELGIESSNLELFSTQILDLHRYNFQLSPNEDEINIEQQEQKRTEKKRCQAITKKGTQCKRSAKEGSDYCWQHDKGKPSSTTSKEKSSVSSSTSDRTIHTGPRGGQYYYNSSGKKVYIKKKK